MSRSGSPGQRAAALGPESKSCSARFIGSHSRRLCYFGEFLLRVAAAFVRLYTSQGEPRPLNCPETGGKWQCIHGLLNKHAHSHAPYTALHFQNNVIQNNIKEGQARSSDSSSCWINELCPLHALKSMSRSSLSLSLWFRRL